MNISEVYRSKYMKAADLQGKVIPVTIKSVEFEEIGEALERKPVLYFQNSERPMVLNKTNAVLLAGSLGDDTREWNGRTVQLCSELTFFQGKQVPCLRIRIPAAPQSRKPSAPVTADAEVDLDDDITF